MKLRRSDIWGVALAYTIIASLVGVPFYLQHQDVQQVHAQSSQLTARLAIATPAIAATSQKVVIEGTPTHMVIDSVGVSLPIVAGTYNSKANTWNVKDAAGNFAFNTYKVNNDKGTTLIYGHNNPYTLGKTKNIQVGAKLLITTDNGHVFSYTYTGDSIVSPNDVSLFGNLDSAQPTLKLMTCSGSWFQNRRLMNFRLDDAV